MSDNGSTIPPDTHGAAGPNHVASILNRGYAVWDKLGNLVQGPMSLQQFWQSLGTGPGQPADFVFDPKILYDQHSGRWMVTTDSNPDTTDSYVLFGISDTNNPSGAWTLYAIDADPDDGSHWADYPGFGVDPGHVYITNNMFPVGSGGFFARFWVIDKASALAGGALVYDVLDDPLGGFTWQPCHAFGATPVNYLVGEGWSGGGTSRALRIQEVSFPAGVTTLTDLGFIRVADYGFDAAFEPDDAPQNGCAQDIETNDYRLLNAVLRNGKIWATNHVDDPVANGTARTEVAWYEFDPTTADGSGTQPTIQEGRVSNPSLWYYFPSIAVNADESVAVGFTGSGSASEAGAYYTGRKSTDPAGTMDAPTLLKAGEDPYYKTFGKGKNRWGDFSATAVDPTDDRTFWTIQEYARTETGAGCPTDNTGIWGTWWGMFEFVETETACFDGVDNDVDGCTDGDDVDCGGTESLCNDFQDDDCDGLVDCADPDCNGDILCPEAGNCADGNDNDLDGCTDGGDSDCGGTEVLCLDFSDDDCDGDADCRDTDCLGNPLCPESGNCADGLDNDLDGCFDIVDSDCGGVESLCGDLLDDDCDGDVDCDDPDCNGDLQCPEAGHCTDGNDNDLDGCTDGDDSDCGGTETACFGAFDDDCDGDIDCADTDCIGDPACAEGTNCFDGLDNDVDGCTDGDDSDCGGTETSCTGGVDEDCDGDVDCADSDCAGNPNCDEAGNCFDLIDNDVDGCTDGDDSDCGGTETACAGGVDDDCDGDVDCADADCVGDPACPEVDCFDLVDNDADGCTDGDDVDCGGTESLCGDFQDDDCDGDVDCRLPGRPGLPGGVQLHRRPGQRRGWLHGR